MLSFMRRQHSRLKWVLVFIIVVLGAGMVISLVPYLGDIGTGVVSGDVARVGGEAVTSQEFQTAYTNYLRNMQQKQQLSPEILKAFGFDRQILEALIGQKVIMAEAKRLGLDVSSDELAQHILTNPGFQDGGSFIGRDRYELLLQQNNMILVVRVFLKSANDCRRVHKSSEVVDVSVGIIPGKTALQPDDVFGAQKIAKVTLQIVL